MVEVGVLEAKTRLSQLLEAAVQGEEVVISRRGKRRVRLAPLEEDDTPMDAEAHLMRLRARIAGENQAPMSEAEVQSEWDKLRGRT